jgi:NodT family efflux transporter outer membrane factor (OMF) lipoprotein
LQTSRLKYASKKVNFGTIAVDTFLFFCCIVSLWGCSPKVAKVDLPYNTLQAFSLSGEEEAPARWWLAFEDPHLNALIDSALQSNLPLKVVWHQMEEAGALLDVTASVRWPQLSLGIQSGFSVPEPDFVGGENTQVSLRAGYEVDLWGRIRYSVHADQYRFRASYYDHKTAAISLSAEIALTYFRLKATSEQLRLTAEQLETNEQVLALIRARFASGQVRGVDILRQQQLIENTKEQKIGLEMQLGVLKNQMAILLCTPPGEDFRNSINVFDSLPELPPLPQTGIPLQLVNRRPDVLSAFYQLQASDRELAAAISNKYPRLNFSITSAYRSNTLEGLLESQAGSLTGSLLAPLFYGRRLKAEVDRAEAVRQQLTNTYGQTVLNAFQEIENNLIQEVKLKEQIEVMEAQLELAGKTFGQLRIEYLSGSLPYLDVLSTLTQQQQLRRGLTDARMTLLEVRIGLYRALAGGFETGGTTGEDM